MFIEYCGVATLTGHTTIEGIAPYKWASKADQTRLSQKIQEYSQGVIVYGSGTFNADPVFLARRAYESGPRRIVLTKEPKKYLSFQSPGKIDFLDLSPQQFVEKFENYNKALLLAGEKLTGAFLEADLVDRVSISLEPILSGRGHGIAIGDFQRRFKLVSHSINKEDPSTLMLCYDRIRANEN